MVFATVSEPSAKEEFPAVAGVACHGLVKDFGSGENRLRALHGIDIDVRCGEMTLLVGPSGCGKTTLISIIAGLLTPTAGSVTLFGTPQSALRGDRLVDFRAQNVGFVFQQYNLLPSLSAVENVSIPLLVVGWRRAAALERAAAVLREVGLGERLHSSPTKLSGGQQQRVAIARALVHEPRLLVCDEPTAALDAQSGQTVMGLLKQVAVRSDRTVIVVTHDSRVFQFGDRVLEMADGRIVQDSVTPRGSQEVVGSENSSS